MKAAFALGFALGAAPGPVQVLILSETARRGPSGGLRVMLGANGTLWVGLLVIALGVSRLSLGDGLLRILRLAGGAFLLWVSITELRALTSGRPRRVSGRANRSTSVGPTTKGVLAVIFNPGAWIFFATTASAVIASATATGGKLGGVEAATAMAVGVSLSDLLVTSLGSGGRAILKERTMRAIQIGLACLLGILGMGLILAGR